MSNEISKNGLEATLKSADTRFVVLPSCRLPMGASFS